MGSTSQRGAGINTPINFPYPAISPAVVQILIGAGPISLPGGAVFPVPAGQYYITPGPYTMLVIKDPVTGFGETIVPTPNVPRYVSSDGANVSLVNYSGCAVGAYITNVGSAYTSAPTVTISAGNSTWKAIVGGAVSGTVTVGTAGVGYNYPPMVIIGPPPAGGIQATAVAVVSAGAVSSVTVINQGAGYTTAPPITLIPNPADTITTAAACTTALTGSGTITAIVRLTHGQPLTSVPTFTISGGGGASAAATAVMAFAATGMTVGTAGVAYGTSKPFLVTTDDGIVAGAAGAVVNPALGSNMFIPRQAVLSGTSTGGGAVTATGLRITDAGLFQAVPNGLVVPGGDTVPTTQAVVTITVGGITDTSYIYPF